MSRLIPILIAVVVIASLTVVEGLMSERWSDSRLCAYCATLLDNVPEEIGEWVGENKGVDEEIQKVAGARGYVSRTYRNENGDVVDVWLIVGHARDTARHTPDVCYTSSGFDFEGIGDQALTLDDGTEVTFFTSVFSKGDSFGEANSRVYWTWFKPTSNSGSPVQWRAPKNIRMEIGAAPALYKLYFTASGSSALVEQDESICLEFAKEFLPAVAPVLAPANGEIPPDFDASTIEEV